MTAKAEYIPNGYVCNKCGSRMDAIITPPLSTLGKIKLVCNNCNKYMTKTWQERFDEMSDINEFYGLPYNDLVDSSIKQFISDIIAQTREETIKKTLKEIRDYIRDNEKLGYENRVLVGDEIYAKLSIIYDKSLINK
ncbi:MAG: hypothetical protein ACOYIG_09955 [Acetivibrionales bacterium]|jgi:hypothetical protein